MLALLTVRNHFPIERTNYILRQDRDLTEFDRIATPTRRPFDVLDYSESVAKVHVAYWANGIRNEASEKSLTPWARVL